MGNGSEPVRTPEEWGHLGGSESGTYSDSYEKEKAGVVRPRQEKRRNREHQSGCRNEDGGEEPQRTTTTEVEGHGQERHESVEYQGGVGHRPWEMEKFVQDPLPRTGRRRRKVRKGEKVLWAKMSSSPILGKILLAFKWMKCSPHFFFEALEIIRTFWYWGILNVRYRLFLCSRRAVWRNVPIVNVSAFVVK